MERNKLIDLHTHTTYSDGQYAPYEVILKARERGIGTIAITDHDTVRGIKSIYKDNFSGIKIIDGIELTAKVDKGQMHILGYGIDPNNEILNSKLSKLRDNSINSFLSVLEQIKKDYDIRFGYDDIKETINADHNLGRPDIAKLCVKYGYAKDAPEAFKLYLNPSYEKVRGICKGIPYEECISLIRTSGGIPVLAHPTTLKLSKDELDKLIITMVINGLQGIEVYHSNQSKKESEYYLSLANKYGLLVSGGSDFHGPNVKPDIELGTGKNNNIKIKKLSILDHLK